MFRFWLRRPFARPARPRVKRAALGVEGLEARDVPTFLAPTSYALANGTGGVTAADFNGDGKADMAVVEQVAVGSVDVMLGNGDGTFQAAVNYPAGLYPADAKAGDFNGDGKPDLAVAGTQGTMSVLLNNGDGTFAAPVGYAVGLGAHAVNAADLNKDGGLDLVTVNGGTASVLLGRGDGSFAPPLNSVLPGNSTNVLVGDYDKDGNPDVATSNTFSTGTVTILRGRGDGSFDPAASVYAFSAPVAVTSDDFNHDGYDDFAVANSYAATSMSVILNNGDGTYAPPVTYGIGQTGYEIEADDFDGDGNADFAVRGASRLMVHLGKGDGTFYPEVGYAVPTGQFQRGGTADFNGDGATDLVYPSTSGVTVVMNSSDGVTSLAGASAFGIGSPSSTTAGSSLPVTVAALDASGNVVPDFRGTVYLTSSDAASATNVAYTFTAADAGVHTFGTGVRLVTLGDQTVTAAAPLMAAASTAVTVAPQVSRFTVSAPAASNAGDSFDVTVTALDAQGNPAVGFTSSVHFTSSDPQAVIPSDYTFTPADAGAHTFTVSLKSSGSRWVGVTEVGGPAGGGAFVSVTPGAAVGFTLAGGGGAIGVARPVSVVARDVYGNTATSYAGTVHVTSSDPRAVLPADAALANGQAVVNVTLLTVGTQTVTATDLADPTLTGTVSTDATPPVPASFAVAGYPATVAGEANTFTVTVRDTIGQVASGFTGTVYFSSSDQQAGLPASYTFTAADAGARSFTATLKTAGNQSIAVRDASGILVGSQVGIAVSPAAFAGFRIPAPLPFDSQGHMLVTAGDSIALTVRATDAYGNTVSGYRGKVKFSSTDAQAGLPADYTFTATDVGVHTFAVSLKTATAQGQVWSFSVADSASAATLSTVTNFEVVNAAAVKFVLNAPTNATAGTPFTVKLTALDAYGNKVKNYFGTVHFGTTSAVAGLPADYAFTGDDAGVHSFTVVLGTAGNQTLSVADLGTPGLTAGAVISVKTSGGGGSGGGGGGGGGGH